MTPDLRKQLFESCISLQYQVTRSTSIMGREQVLSGVVSMDSVERRLKADEYDHPLTLLAPDPLDDNEDKYYDLDHFNELYAANAAKIAGYYVREDLPYYRYVVVFLGASRES